MATSALMHHHAAASISLAAAHPVASGSNAVSGTPADTGGATISGNDFLTLLVTEMQNQDPTSTTDPNEYINQLVNVNSLEQLIQINQTLSSAVPPATSGAVGSSNLVRSINGGAAIPDSPAAASTQPASPPLSAHAVAHPAASAPAAAPVVSGNLSAPPSNPAALRVASALGSSRMRR